MAEISNALTDNFSPAEAFYVVFRALPEEDRLAVVSYILEDEEIWQSPEFSEIPNETTLQAFSEDLKKHSISKKKSAMQKPAGSLPAAAGNLPAAKVCNADFGGSKSLRCRLRPAAKA